MVSIPVLALAQMLRLVDNGLKFCKQRFKYGHHNFFSTSTFENLFSGRSTHIPNSKVIMKTFVLLTFRIAPDV